MIDDINKNLSLKNMLEWFKIDGEWTIVEEEWRPVKDYEGLYEVSSFGRVKSLKRRFVKKDRILRLCYDKNKYMLTVLSKNLNAVSRSVHQLVVESFLGHDRRKTKLVVDHINFKKDFNVLENLRLVTIRENSNMLHLASSSKYTGVDWNKKSKRWTSGIVINGAHLFIGSFDDELKASEAYFDILHMFNNGTLTTNIYGEGILKYRAKMSSIYKGVFWSSRDKRWYAMITVNKKKHYLGSSKTEELANKLVIEGRKKYKK